MIDTHRIHVTGASGCGVTTLGKALANELCALHVDADGLYWLPTDPPFTEKRERGARLRIFDDLVRCAGDRGWVLSGSVLDWGDELIPRFTLIIFLNAPLEVRLDRLRAREKQRFGARIALGGGMFDIHRAFIEWAAGYDDGSNGGRTRERHEAWLAPR